MKNKIKKEISFYKSEGLELNPSFAQTQPELLELIDYYLASKYKSGDHDRQGEKKPFLNVLDNPSWVASKGIDIDMKDITFTTERTGEYWATWLYDKLFRIWGKENELGKKINDMVYSWPRYGSIVAKRVRGDFHSVPVRNIISDPTSSTLSDPLIEKHRYSLSEFEEEAESADWENYKDVLEYKSKNNENFVDVYERQGKIKDSDANWGVWADKSDGELNLVEMATDKFKEGRYRSLPWEKVWGRWLGRGQCERLLENQIAKNESEYYFRKGLKWTSLRIFQTRDQNIANNVLTDLENGDILRVLSELQPVATEERNLGAFNYGDQKWDMNRNERAFSHDIMKGQRPAAGTPLGTSQLQAAQAGGYFGFMRENLGIFLRGIIKDWVIPSFEKSVNDENDLIFDELSSDELQTLRGLLTDQRARKIKTRFIGRNMRLPTGAESRIMKEVSEAMVSRQKGMKIGKDIFRNLSYKLNINITGEQLDLQSRIATAQMLVQMIGSNPVIFQNPRMRNQLSKILDWAGLNPQDMLGAEEMENINRFMPQRGGSLPTTPQTATPQRTKMTQEV